MEAHALPQFDRSRLKLKPLAERVHDMTLAEMLPLDAAGEPFEHPSLPIIAQRILQARRNGAPVIVLMGAHVIKSGLSRFIIDLMARGIITHVGMNGAGPIHDFELALVGATTESVARYIQEGQFGLWNETGWINDIVAEGVRDGLGYGEALGREISKSANQQISKSPALATLPLSRFPFPTPTSASSPRAIACACRSRCTSGWATTSSTSTRTATARRWARRRIAIS